MRHIAVISRLFINDLFSVVLFNFFDKSIVALILPLHGSLQQMAIRFRPFRLLPMHLHPAPTMLTILTLYLCTLLQPPLRHAHHQTTLKHKRTAPGTHLGRLQLGLPRPLVALRVRPMPTHDIMQARAAGHKAAGPALLSVVAARNQAHELAHCVAVVPRRAERVLADQPSRREDHEIRNRRARVLRHAAQHGEYGRVRVVEADAADRVEAAQVVLIGVIRPVPRDDVKGRMSLRGRVEGIRELGRHRVLGGAVKRDGAAVLVKGGHGCLEVARVGQPVAPYGAQLGQRKMALVKLQGVAADWLVVGQVDGELGAAGDDGDLEGADEQPALLGADVEDARLRDEKQVAVGGIEGVGGRHGGGGGEDIHAKA